MIADLDTLLIALYVELTDRVIPAVDPRRRGPGRPLEVTDAELVCLAVAQVLLRYNDERHWLRAAADRVGHLFPRLLSQSEYNQRLKDLAPLMEAALGWLAAQTPGSAELLRLLDGTPVGCGQSPITAKRSGLFGYAGYGYESSHSRYYWGVKLLLICTAEGTVTGFGLANPKLVGEQEAVRQLLGVHPSTRPPRAAPWSPTRAWLENRPRSSSPALVCTWCGQPARTNTTPGLFPNWLRQRVEAIIWTLNHQLGLEGHGGRGPRGLWARIVQRLLALNATIWHNWAIGAPVKRSLIAYDH